MALKGRGWEGMGDTYPDGEVERQDDTPEVRRGEGHAFLGEEVLGYIDGEEG